MFPVKRECRTPAFLFSFSAIAPVIYSCYNSKDRGVSEKESGCPQKKKCGCRTAFARSEKQIRKKINNEKRKEQSSSEERRQRNENLLIRLNQNYGKLSKGQKRLADFITAHYDQAVSMTAARLGQQVGVSESTTVRFAMQLGYAGYPEFSAHWRRW